MNTTAAENSGTSTSIIASRPLSASSGRREHLGARHWVFIGSIVALDFAVGQFSKSLLRASGISNFIRLDMFIPVMFWMLTRLIVDRFGTLTAYQFGWGVLAVFAFPGSMLPGPLKLIPALLQGVLHDAGFSLLHRFPRARVFVSAIVGGLLSKAATAAIRVQVLDLPWTRVTETLYGVQALTSILVNAVAAAVALAIWSRIRDLQITRMLRVQA
jgi:hypothetical protein